MNDIKQQPKQQTRRRKARRTAPIIISTHAPCLEDFKTVLMAYFHHA